MALQKQIPTDYGVTVSYHRIKEVYISYGNPNGCFARFVLVSYPSQQERLDNKTPLVVEAYDMSYVPKSDEDARVQIYAYIKTMDKYSGAEDV